MYCCSSFLAIKHYYSLTKCFRRQNISGLAGVVKVENYCYTNDSESEQKTLLTGRKEQLKTMKTKNPQRNCGGGHKNALKHVTVLRVYCILLYMLLYMLLYLMCFLCPAMYLEEENQSCGGIRETNRSDIKFCLKYKINVFEWSIFL